MILQDTRTREVWENNLGIVLQENNVICELHFGLNDVIKEDVTYCKDGSISKIPRFKNALRTAATPLSISDNLVSLSTNPTVLKLIFIKIFFKLKININLIYF